MNKNQIEQLFTELNDDESEQIKGGFDIGWFSQWLTTLHNSAESRMVYGVNFPAANCESCEQLLIPIPKYGPEEIERADELDDLNALL